MKNSPANQRYDIVVIGAGHNGLVAAAYLAKAGQQVLVLERRESVGGAASTEEIFPGFRVNTGAADAGLFLPEIVSELNLPAFGLHWIESPAIVFSPQPDGRSLTLWRDPKRAIAEIAGFSKTDADRYPAFLRFVSRFREVLRHALTVSPPSLPEIQAGELIPWVRTAYKLRLLGKQEMMDLLRVLPMPVDDFLDEWFSSEALKAAVGTSGVTGSFLGPKSSGTAFMLLYQALQAHQAGFRASRFVQGGTGNLSNVLAQVAARHGAEICTGVGVSEILSDGNAVSGVILENGEHIDAKIVVSNADPRRTFFDLVGAQSLEVRFVREVKNIRQRSSLARVNLALSGLPEFTGGLQAYSGGNLSGHIVICPSLEYLERAYDHSKYGQFSDHPMLDIVIPTVSDPTLAPPGKHILTVDVYYAPFNLQDGHWEGKREEFLDVVLQTLAAYAPAVQDLITNSQVMTPVDMERQFGLTNGDIYHAQMGLDQLLMMRPVPGYSRYRTPLDNLFICGSGTHPGGGVTGAPGYNAAREILKFLS